MGARLAFAVFVCAASAAAAAQTPAVPRDAETVLAAARSALGGEARLSAVKTLLASGRTRQVRGDNLVPIEFEIAIELPDKYVRKDEVPAQETGPTIAGFNGNELLGPSNAGLAGRPGGPPPTAEQLQAARAGRLAGVKQDFARLMVGLFATSFSSYPLTFTYVGQAEAPQGMADVLEAKGQPNFTMRLFVYKETHLPVMVSWQGPPPGQGRGPGGPPTGRGPAAGSPPPAGRAQAAGQGEAQATPPENRIYFADYREVDGVKLPFRLRRATGPDTVEETTFDRFRINTRIDPKRFEVGR